MTTRILVLAAAVAVGCATAPQTVSERDRLETQARVTLQQMRTRDPGLNDLLYGSAGYVVFPAVGKGGLGVGGAFGRGVLFEHGRPTGYVKLTQASIGAQAGGEQMAELIVLRDETALDRIKAGHYELGASASAIALTEGAAAEARFDNGIAVFALPLGGLMVDLTITGQKLDYDRG